MATVVGNGFHEPSSNHGAGCPREVMVKAMDCGIVVSEFVLQSRYSVHFQANTLGKGMNPISSQLWVKYYHYCSSRRIALALNNLKKVDMPLNKEIKSWTILFMFKNLGKSIIPFFLR